MAKQTSNNDGLPLFNREPGGPGKIEIIYEPHPEIPHVVKVCTEGKSDIYATLIRQKEHVHRRKKYLARLALNLIEIRANTMPIIEAFFLISGDSEMTITPETKIGALIENETQLYFPIDEEDEDEMLGLFARVKDKLDLTKIPELPMDS